MFSFCSIAFIHTVSCRRYGPERDLHKQSVSTRTTQVALEPCNRGGTGKEHLNLIRSSRIAFPYRFMKLLNLDCLWAIALVGGCLGPVANVWQSISDPKPGP